jgi:hypothetical protein
MGAVPPHDFLTTGDYNREWVSGNMNCNPTTLVTH